MPLSDKFLFKTSVMSDIKMGTAKCQVSCADWSSKRYGSIRPRLTPTSLCPTLPAKEAPEH